MKVASGSVSASDEPGRTHGASSTWANGPYHSPSTRIEKRSAAAALARGVAGDLTSPSAAAPHEIFARITWRSGPLGVPFELGVVWAQRICSRPDAGDSSAPSEPASAADDASEPEPADDGRTQQFVPPEEFASKSVVFDITAATEPPAPSSPDPLAGAQDWSSCPSTSAPDLGESASSSPSPGFRKSIVARQAKPVHHKVKKIAEAHADDEDEKGTHFGVDEDGVPEWKRKHAKRASVRGQSNCVP